MFVGNAGSGPGSARCFVLRPISSLATHCDVVGRKLADRHKEWPAPIDCLAAIHNRRDIFGHRQIGAGEFAQSPYPSIVVVDRRSSPARSSSGNLRASILSFLLPPFSRAFFRGSINASRRTVGIITTQRNARNSFGMTGILACHFREQ